MHLRTNLAADGAGKDLRRLNASLALIDMWIRLVNDEGIGIRDQLRRHVGMVVVGYDNGNLITHLFAHRLQQIPFGVFVRLGHHRPVQIQKHAVEPASFLQPR